MKIIALFVRFIVCFRTSFSYVMIFFALFRLVLFVCKPIVFVLEKLCWHCFLSYYNNFSIVDVSNSAAAGLQPGMKKDECKTTQWKISEV